MASWFGRGGAKEESPTQATDAFEYERKGHAPFIEKPPSKNDPGIVASLLGGASSSAAASPGRVNHFKYIVVGGGVACGYAIRELIQNNIDGNEILLICGEKTLPYERPALTKAYLHPPDAKVRARLPGFHTCVGTGGERQTRDWYADKGITVRMQNVVKQVIPTEKRIVVQESRTQFTYDHLFVATGCRCFYPINEDEGIFTLRSEADAADLVEKLELAKRQRLVVVGGGYTGVEVAAAATGWMQTGHLQSVHLVNKNAHLLQNIFGNEAGLLGDYIDCELEARGLVIKHNSLIKQFDKLEDGSFFIKLSNGEALECDLVFLGTGARPNSELFADIAGLNREGYVVVDENFRVPGLQEVYVFGDVAAYPDEFGNLVKMEHVSHARASAQHAVRVCLKKVVTGYQYTPFFYSRVLEFSDKPLIWNLWGYPKRNSSVLNFPISDSLILAVWMMKKQFHSFGLITQICGACLMGCPGPSQKLLDRVKAMVMDRKKVGDMREAINFLKNESIWGTLSILTQIDTIKI